MEFGETSRALDRNNKSRALRWLGEQTLAWWIPIIWSLVASNTPVWGDEFTSPFGWIGIQILNPVVIVVIAYFVGRYMQSVVRPDNVIGKWVWILPLVFFALGTFHDYCVGHLTWHSFASNYLFSFKGKMGPFLREILTYPVLSSIAYSLGSWTQQRANQQSPAN